jgi:hypothetical protein
MQPGGARRWLLGFALATACAAAPPYARPAGTFQQGFAEAAPVIRAVYTELNALRRDAYFTRLACDAQAELVEVDAEGRQTPLNRDAFSAESIQARVDAVELLGRYADRLAALASGDAAGEARLSEAATALGANLTGLGARFAELPDATADDYAGPVGEVAAAVTRAVLADGAAKGCTNAALRSGPKSIPLYERLGFRYVCQHRTYAAPA